MSTIESVIKGVAIDETAGIPLPTLDGYEIETRYAIFANKGELWMEPWDTMDKAKEFIKRSPKNVERFGLHIVPVALVPLTPTDPA